MMEKPPTPSLSPPEMREMRKAEGLTAGRTAFFDQMLVDRLCKAGFLVAAPRPDQALAPTRPSYLITDTGRQAMIAATPGG